MPVESEVSFVDSGRPTCWRMLEVLLDRITVRRYNNLKYIAASRDDQTHKISFNFTNSNKYNVNTSLSPYRSAQYVNYEFYVALPSDDFEGHDTLEKPELQGSESSSRH